MFSFGEPFFPFILFFACDLMFNLTELRLKRTMASETMKGVPLMAGPITYDRNLFADNLQRLMRENHEKQIDIARLLKVSKSTVSAYCSGSQMPRMDKIEQLAQHFGVSRGAMLGEDAQALPSPAPVPVPVAPELPIAPLYHALNERGRGELIRYGRYLVQQPEYKAEEQPEKIVYIKHYLVPAAAGYASPIEGEDYENIPLDPAAPVGADFCITVRGDSMEPFIPDGSLVYVRRGAPLQEFEVGIFFVDGDVFCKQWCVDYAGTLHLLSANPVRQDANISIPRDAGRSCICFGKVLLDHRLPQPSYY